MKLKKEFEKKRKSYLNFDILTLDLPTEYIYNIYNLEERG